VIPPDPALEDESTEVSFSQPGQVWYPDSSFKTAQAIRDFRCEDLPLFVLANWRGFSGGQRDMFHEILKYGSYIVDELADYQHPVFMYLPPTAELRGGAWVVLDSLINDRRIEMYAADGSKANVLEPTGVIGLKFRKKKLLETMHRIDPQLMALDGNLRKMEKISPNDVDSIKELRKEIENRERGLFPIYNKIALMFAMCHDTPQRMKDVGVINEVVPWTNSRRYFYWRLRRRLLINRAIDQMVKDMALKETEWKEAQKTFDEWVGRMAPVDDDEKRGDEVALRSNDAIIRDDREFVEWFQTQTAKFGEFRQSLQMQSVENRLASIIGQFDGDKQQLAAMFGRLVDGRKRAQSETTDID